MKDPIKGRKKKGKRSAKGSDGKTGGEKRAYSDRNEGGKRGPTVLGALLGALWKKG